MRIAPLLRLIICVLIATICQIPTSAGSSLRKKYPGGKYYIWRYTLKDKQGTTYSLEHPGRWLTHRSLERRKRQGITVDSTDLPVSARYLKQIEQTLKEPSGNGRKKYIDSIGSVVDGSDATSKILGRSQQFESSHPISSML